MKISMEIYRREPRRDMATGILLTHARRPMVREEDKGYPKPYLKPT